MIPTKKPLADSLPSQPMPQQTDVQVPDSVDGQSKSSGKIWLWIAIPVVVAAVAGAVLYLGKGDKSQKTDDDDIDVSEELVQMDVAGEFAQMEQELVEIEEIETEEDIDGYVEEFTPVDMIIVDDTDTYEPAAIEAPAETPASDFFPESDDLKVVREHKNESVIEERKPVAEEEKVFTSVEEMPKFPGGESELMKYIANHIAYPADAAEEGIQGKVVVQFVVARDGSIGEVKVLRGKHPSLDREALRVVRSFPRFIPGKMNGQPVNVWYTLPITFKLQGV